MPHTTRPRRARLATPTDLRRFVAKNGWPFGPVAVDTETSGLFVDDGARVATVSVAWMGPDGVVALAWPFDQGILDKPEAVGKKGEAVVGEDDDANLDQAEWVALMYWLKYVAAERSAGLVFHNAKFDLQMLIAGCRRWPGLGMARSSMDGVVWDSQLVNGLIWPLALDPKKGWTRTTSLKPTAARLWGEAESDEQGKVRAYLRQMKLPAGRWDLMPWSVIGDYAAKDAELTLRLYLHQKGLIEAGQAGAWLGGPKQVLEQIDFDLQIMRVLLREELRGIPYDQGLSREIGTKLRQTAAQIAQRLPYRPTLPAAKAYYFGEGEGALRLPPYGITDRGEPQLTEQIVSKMISDGVGGESIKDWRDFQKVSRARSMWYEAYADAVGPDGRLRTSFRQAGTVSGRFSCERVNLQAIPQDYRLGGFEILHEYPTPRGVIASGASKIEGWDLWELDLAQAELRVAAAFAECTPMLDAIAHKQDLHGQTASALFDSSPDDPNWDLHRQVGKRGNFALIFGSGALTFQAMLAKELDLYWDLADVERIVRDWNGLYPQFRRAIDVHMDRVARRQITGTRNTPDQGGWIGTWGKNRRWFDRYEDSHKAFNQRVQGSLAVLGKRWLVEADQYLMGQGVGRKMDGTDGGLLLTIHDSLVLGLPKGKSGSNHAARVRQIGLDVWDSMFPDVPGDIDLKQWKAKQ